MTLSSLREDVPVLQDKESILLNSKEYKNFFVVPKRAKQEIEE